MVIDADVRGQIPKGVRRYFMLTEMVSAPINPPQVEYFELVGKWLDAELKYHTSVRQLAQIHNAEKEKDNKEERKGNGSRIGRSGTRSGSGSGFTLAAPPEEEPTLCPICSDEPVVIQCSECDQVFPADLQVFCGKCDSVAHRYQEEHQRQRLTRRKMRSNVSASSSYSSEEPSDPGLVRRSGSASMLSSFVRQDPFAEHTGCSKNACPGKVDRKSRSKAQPLALQFAIQENAGRFKQVSQT